MIKFHDPRGDVGTQIEAYDLAHVIAGDGGGTTIGLLANGFPDSENFLNALRAQILKRFPAMSVLSWNKGNASIPAPQSMLDEIKQKCQVVIAAWGH